MISKEQIDGFNVYLTDKSKGMIGNILTILEVLGMAESQEKAIKALLKKEMWAHHTGVLQFFNDHIAYPDEALR